MTTHRELHAARDQAGEDLARLVDNVVLGRAHVERAHVAEFLDQARRDEALDGERAKGAAACGAMGGQRRHEGSAGEGSAHSWPAKERTIGAVMVCGSTAGGGRRGRSARSRPPMTDNEQRTATLETVRERHQSEVGDDAGNADAARDLGERVGARDEVLDGRGVENCIGSEGSVVCGSAGGQRGV